LKKRKEENLTVNIRTFVNIFHQIYNTVKKIASANMNLEDLITKLSYWSFLQEQKEVY